MKTIPTTIKREGFTWTLLERNGMLAIYEQRKTYSYDCPDFIRYEVVIVRKHNRDNDFVGTKAGDEYLPCPAEWGVYGWTYTTIEEAREKMSKIVLEKSEKT